MTEQFTVLAAKYFIYCRHNKQYVVWLQLGCVQGLHLVMRIWTFPKREVREGRREGRIMVRYNEDAEVVARIRECSEIVQRRKNLMSQYIVIWK